ncbi:MAG: DUF6531 domain-containing protein, partial [Chlamydiia bacterium]
MNRLFLVLFLLPCWVFSISQADIDKDLDKIRDEWERCNELIVQYNALDPSLTDAAMEVLNKATTSCHLIGEVCDKWTGYYYSWSFLPSKDVQDRKRWCYEAANEIKKAVAIRFFQINACRKKIWEERSLDRVYYLLKERPRNLQNAKVGAKTLKEVIYNYNNAIGMSDSPQKRKEYEEALLEIQKERGAWSRYVTLEKLALKEHVDALIEDCEQFAELGFIHHANDLRKQALLVYEELLAMGFTKKELHYVGIEDEISLDEPLELLKKEIALFEDEAGKDRLTKKENPFIPEDFAAQEELRTELFYQDREALHRKKSCLNLLELNPFVSPLDGQKLNASGKQLLYTEQFYRTFLRSTRPISQIFVKVSKDGALVHEEKILLPLLNTLLWDLYLADEGMVTIPNTMLKKQFQLDLRFRFAWNQEGLYALIIGQKGMIAGYEVTIGLEENNPLIKSLYFEAPPWQLEALRKPALPKARGVWGEKEGQKGSFAGLAASKPTLFFDKVPVLDQLVLELNRDPLLLAQYVYHEIGLVNPFSGEAGASGMQRSLSVVYLEKEGSALEQCHLLAYLLHKAGCEVRYLHHDTQHPGILFFNGEDWISLFPWMKEAHIEEGHHLYSLLPEDFSSADRWIRQYLRSDPRINQHIGSDGDDSAALLFVRFVEDELRKQQRSLNDVGRQIVYIKRLFSSFEDFPRPPSLEGYTVLSSLEDFPESFATVNLEIFSEKNREKKGAIQFRLVDLGADTIPIRFMKEGDKTLLRFRSLKETEEHILELENEEQMVLVKVRHEIFIGGKLVVTERTFSLQVESLAAVCFHFGGSNSAKTTKFFDDFSLANGEEEKFHTLLSFMGAAYFEKCSRARQALAKIHKVSDETLFAVGLTKFHKTKPQLDMIWVPATRELDRDYHPLATIDASSNEHQTLKEIFKDPTAISAVKLLQLAHLEHKKKGLKGDGFLTFTASNFAFSDSSPEAAKVRYFPHIDILDIKALKAASLGQWNALREVFDWKESLSSWTYAYVTPGLVDSFEGKQREAGAIILWPTDSQSLLSSNCFVLNGGEGASLAERGIEPSSIGEWSLSPSCETLYTNDIYFNNHSVDLPPPPGSQFIQGIDIWDMLPPVVLSLPVPNHSELLRFYEESLQRPQPSFMDDEEKKEEQKLEEQEEPEKPKEPSKVSNLAEFMQAQVHPDFKAPLELIGDPIDVVNGAFYINDVDVFLPGAVPLELRRNYSSLNQASGAFGNGWKINLNPNLVERDGKRYIAELDGTVIVYSYNSSNARWEVSLKDNPELARLPSHQNPFQLYMVDDVLYSPDGSRRFFEDGLLLEWMDAQGNTTGFAYEEGRLVRVETSSGEFFGIYYNYRGMVSEIYAKEGRRVYYEYNNLGDLTRVILPNKAVITYEYDSFHRIIRETRPHGRVTENIYDDQGRVIEQRTPAGLGQELTATAKLAYSEGETIVTDGEGEKTIYKIQEGQMVEIIDPAGTRMLQFWSKEAGYPSLKSTVDKRGLQTNYSYDDRGNIISIQVEGEGYKSEKRFAYDSKNLCIEEVLEDQKTVTTYDKTFVYLPKRVETTIENTLISYVEFDYNDQGCLIREDRNGAITLLEYDSSGRICRKIQETGTEDPAQVTTFAYNHMGQCIKSASADGIVERRYDVMGNLVGSRVLDISGKVISTSFSGYDLNNALIWKQGANPGHTVSLDLHFSGEVKASRQTLGSEDEVAYTLYDYDKRGCLTREIDPRGFATYREYDSLMRLVRETKEGHTTTLTYEAGGLVESVTTPSGAKTTQKYTVNGLLNVVEFPDGTKNFTTYDLFGRPIVESKNGVTWQSSYDDVQHRIVSLQLETGIQEIKEFDARGNLIGFTDAAGFVTKKTYDALGRVKTITNPEGEVTSWSYQGDTTICTRPNSEREITRTVAGQVAEVSVVDPYGALLSYASYDLDLKNSIEISTQGDVTTTVWKNAFGLPYKTKTGELFTTCEYDACGNCVAITDGEGRTTRQQFDGLSRLVKKELPDGSIIEYVYDLDSNLILTRLPNGSTWVASYDLMKRKCSEELQAGDTVSEHWDYIYESGQLVAKIDPMGRTHTYTYDLLNRLSSEVIDGWHRLYTYDVRGLLTSLEQYKEESGWLFSGKTAHSHIKRSYNGTAKLIEESIILNNKVIQQTTLNHSPEGRLLKIGDHERHYTYQNRRLTQVDHPHVTLNYSYNLAGGLIEKKGPYSASKIDYNDAFLPKKIETFLPEITHQEAFDWDRTGKLIHYSTPKKGKAFTYTPRGYLASAGSEEYDFDPNGVRLHAPHSRVLEGGLDPFGKVILESDRTTTYDQMGQTILQNETTFTWDPWGRLLKVTTPDSTWEATYDALGRRLQTSFKKGYNWAITTTSYFDPEEEFREIGITQGGKTYWKFYGPSTLDALTDNSGAKVSLYYNGLRQLRAIVTAKGTEYLEKGPSAYGYLKGAPLSTSTLLDYAKSLAWQSLSTDPTGLIWMGARYYDPKGGRFLSPDPISHPACLDLYTYGNSDPINHHDPAGRCASAAYKNICAYTPFRNIGSLLFNDMGMKGTAEKVFHVDSHIYKVGSRPLRKGCIIFINGINNTKEDAVASALQLSKYGDGAEICGIYNATNGIPLDVGECGVVGLTNMNTPPATLLKNKIDELIATRPSDENFLVVCHSGGGIHLNNFLKTAPTHVQERLIVLTISSAAIIPQEICFQSFNYASTSDLVPKIGQISNLACRNEIHYLKPHPDADLVDHAFLSPTFAEPLE